MNSLKSTRKSPGKRILSAIGGGLVGYASISVFLASGLGKVIAALGPGPLLLAGSGLIYLIMALIVGLGALFPAMGSRFLNVADRDDLEDQRGMLLAGTATFVLLAALQLVLALAGPGGRIADQGAIVFSLAALAAVLAISLRQWRQHDEMLRQLSWEGAGMAMLVLFVILGIWAGGILFAGWSAIDPHAVLATLFGSILIGSFLATGMRGLLHQD